MVGSLPDTVHNPADSQLYPNVTGYYVHQTPTQSEQDQTGKTSDFSHWCNQSLNSSHDREVSFFLSSPSTPLKPRGPLFANAGILPASKTKYSDGPGEPPTIGIFSRD